MLDLDILINRKMRVKIGGETITLKEPSMGDFEEMIEIEELSGKDALRRQKQWLLGFLNSNEEGKTYSEAFLSTISRAAVVAFWRHVVQQCNQTLTEKN